MNDQSMCESHNTKRRCISIYAVATMHYISTKSGTESHPAIYDPETHTIWYWPNVIQEPGKAGEFADKALKSAWNDYESNIVHTIEEFQDNISRFNIYPIVLGAL